MNEDIKPGLSQYVTFGRNGHGETAEVVLHGPEHNYQKTIIDHEGRFEDFPGIVQGKWTDYLEGKFDFDEGRVRYRTSFEEHGDGYRCFWEIQPDGRYWADEDGFGAEDDSEIILYADLDSRGVFKGPFRIYKIDGRRVEEPEEQDRQTSKPASEERTIEQCVADVLDQLYQEINEEMPDTGNYESIKYGFHVPKSTYIACVGIEDSELEKDKRVMKVVVFRECSDRFYTYFFDHLTSQEMKAYVRSEETLKNIVSSVKHLTGKEDEDWSVSAIMDKNIDSYANPVAEKFGFEGNGFVKGAAKFALKSGAKVAPGKLEESLLDAVVS